MQLKKGTASSLEKAEIFCLSNESTKEPEEVSCLDALRHRLAIAGQNVRNLFYLQPGKCKRAGVTKTHMRPRNKKRVQMAKRSRRINRGR